MKRIVLLLSFYTVLLCAALSIQAEDSLLHDGWNAISPREELRPKNFLGGKRGLKTARGVYLSSRRTRRAARAY